MQAKRPGQEASEKASHQGLSIEPGVYARDYYDPDYCLNAVEPFSPAPAAALEPSTWFDDATEFLEWASRLTDGYAPHVSTAEGDTAGLTYSKFVAIRAAKAALSVLARLEVEVRSPPALAAIIWAPNWEEYTIGRDDFVGEACDQAVKPMFDPSVDHRGHRLGIVQRPPPEHDDRAVAPEPAASPAPKVEPTPAPAIVAPPAIAPAAPAVAPAAPAAPAVVAPERPPAPATVAPTPRVRLRRPGVRGPDMPDAYKLPPIELSPPGTPAPEAPAAPAPATTPERPHERRRPRPSDNIG